MTSLGVWSKSLLVATMTAGLGIFSSTSGHAGSGPAADCAAGPQLCYDLPANAGSPINTQNFEGGPSLSQDGLTLLFGAARQNSLGQFDEDIYIATRETTNEPFGPAQSLGPSVNALGFGDYSPELSADGLTLYFSSSRPGGFGAADLYITTRESTDDPWEPPQNLGPNVNSAYFDGQPSISANGKTLYWDSSRPDGFGDFDIWMATRAAVSEAFGPAVNVGSEVNTPGPEFGPAISQNERQLFFSSGRPGNIGQIDIWVVERSKNRHDVSPWGTPINVETLNSPFFQAMPTFRANGKEVCFMSFRPGGFGGLDIWCAARSH
jgi:Tol biopolymer transport system component